MPVAGDLEDRVRRWLSSYNTDKLTQDDIFSLMNEAADELVELFDIWFCKIWGSRTRDADNAVWATASIPPPLDSGGAPLSEAQIAAGSVPANVEYLRAVPFPERLRRPSKIY